MDPAYIARFSIMEEISRTHTRATLLVNDGGHNMILKLFSYLVDVSVIVQHMATARTMVPVPIVFDYGYSGNCSYILMEKINDAWTLDECLKAHNCRIPIRVTNRIKDIVADLASLGLSHNDLTPRNVMVDTSWRLVSIIDWDDCSNHIYGGEYARRVAYGRLGWHTDDQEWDYIFLKHAVDRHGELLLLETRNSRMHRHPPLNHSLRHRGHIGTGQSQENHPLVTVPPGECHKHHSQTENTAHAISTEIQHFSSHGV